MYIKKRRKCPKILDGTFTTNLLLTKFESWKYEQEYRFWIELKSMQKDTDERCFVDFSEAQLKLTHVIVGARSSISRSKVTEALGDLDKSVKKFRAEVSSQSFKIVKSKDPSAWCLRVLPDPAAEYHTIEATGYGTFTLVW